MVTEANFSRTAWKDASTATALQVHSFSIQIISIPNAYLIIRQFTKTFRLDATQFKEHIKPDYFNEILLWTCQDECIYHCMWRTTNAFVSREWAVPQFYGKWPFKRFLGIQEPASVFFSFLNLMAHWRMIRKFRHEVRSDSPMYYIWHIFSGVSIILSFSCFIN